MGKKKRKKGGRGAGRPEKDTSNEFGNRPFEKGLAGLSRKKRKSERDERAELEAERRRRKALVEEAAAASRDIVGAKDLRLGNDVEMSDEDLFKAAISDLDARKIHSGKYGGLGPVAKHVKAPVSAPEAEADPYSTGQALFAAEFMKGEIVPMEKRYHVPEPGAGIDVSKLYKLKADEAVSQETREEAVQRVISGAALSRDQRELVAAAKRSSRPIEEINLRQMPRQQALSDLEAAVDAVRRKDLSYLRVITGKGLQSVGEPVLKVLLVEWCLVMSLPFAPEVLPDGGFGSFIVRVPRGKAHKGGRKA